MDATSITQWPDFQHARTSIYHQPAHWHTRTHSHTHTPTLTAQTGSRVSPTRKVTSHSSGMDARNFMSSASPVLFSNVDRSGSASAMPGNINASGIWVYCNEREGESEGEAPVDI